MGRALQPVLFGLAVLLCLWPALIYGAQPFTYLQFASAAGRLKSIPPLSIWQGFGAAIVVIALLAFAIIRFVGGRRLQAWIAIAMLLGPFLGAVAWRLVIR